MARIARHDVDFFPFYVKDGKTLYILESKYGLQGIGFFTNLMRFLCKQPDHHICIEIETDRLYFFAQIHSAEDIGMDMLNLMAKTGKIDQELWESRRVIVSSDLLESLNYAYSKRINKIVEIATIRHNFPGKAITVPDMTTNAPEMIQSKVKKSKVNNSSRDLTITDDDKSSPCPHQEIINLYHKTLPELPKMKVWTPKRQSHLRSRWNEDKSRQNIEWWGGYFERIKASPFLTGNVNDFKADLEWVINQSNMVKILEGKYDGERTSRTRAFADRNDNRSHQERAIDAETERLNTEYYKKQKAKDANDSGNKSPT